MRRALLAAAALIGAWSVPLAADDCEFEPRGYDRSAPRLQRPALPDRAASLVTGPVVGRAAPSPRSSAEPRIPSQLSATESEPDTLEKITQPVDEPEEEATQSTYRPVFPIDADLTPEDVILHLFSPGSVREAGHAVDGVAAGAEPQPVHLAAAAEQQESAPQQESARQDRENAQLAQADRREAQPARRDEPVASDAQPAQEDREPQPGEEQDQPVPQIPPRIQRQIDAQSGVDDRINDIIKQIDPQELAKLAGADVTFEMVGDQVILQGPEEAVRVLELLILALNEDYEAKTIEIVTVTERDANEIARTVQQSVNKAFESPTRRLEDEVLITALSSNVLLVAALPSEIDFVIDVIEQVDAVPDPLGKIELMTFEVKHRRASEVARELEDFIKTYREVRGAKGEKIQIKANPNNTISVTARESERETIQRILDTIDVPPAKGFGELRLTLFPLLHSRAEDLATVIDNLLKTQATGDRQALEELILRLQLTRVGPDGTVTEMDPIDLQKNIKIIPDGGTNSLIVATSEENVGPVGELIRMLDGVPLAAEVAVRVFPLKFAAADKTADTLQAMFDDGKDLTQDPDGSGDDAVPPDPQGRALVYNVGIASDERTNTLIVSGRPEQLELVARILEEIDRPATGLKFPLRLVRLDYTDATQLGKTLTELFDKRAETAQNIGMTGAALEREKVFLSVDIPTNSLIVSASEENFEEIVAIAKQLDAKPGRLFDQIRILFAGRLSATNLKEQIDELWKRKGDLRRESEMLEDLPVVVADERSNSLVIASSLEDYEEIERLVETLKSRPLIGDTELFKLEHADAAVLAAMLDELFQGVASASETFQEPTIIPDPRSNALIVAASQDAMERVADVIRRLDVEAGPLTSVFKVYPLSNASAAQLSPRIQELFESREEGQEQKGTPVVILPDEASNSLVVSASRDDHAILTGLLELLDRPSTLARNVRIFPLKLAKSQQVAEKLEALFQSRAEGAGGGRADAIAVEADDRTNSIIVWASPSQMQNVVEVITKLDTAIPVQEMMVKVIQLKQALAEDFARLLEESFVGEGGEDERAFILSFTERTSEGREIVRRLLRQDITVKPDPRTNSLMIVAPSDSMAMLESMIRDFDRIRPVTSEVRLFPLINSDAETMMDKLTELFEPKTGGGAEGEVQSQLTFGAEGAEELASIGQELRFTADRRTNTLIAAGAEVNLRIVEDLVRYLDALEAEDRVTEVYPTKFRNATELAEAVKTFVDQEIDALGESEDEESRMRRMERQISIEAIGDPEKGSSSLLVGTSRRAYQRTMELIQGLDRPEPQVMISVLIAEVTLNNDLDLGVEIAGQDLTFSEGAVVGPNGIIQGADFDVVGGSSLGAAGPLGFSFTVTGEDFNFLFHALQQDNRLEVLSRPVLMVRNGEEGNITIADQVPVVSSTQTTDSGQVNVTPGREDVGIVLTATPHISPDGYVTIEMTQEISNIGGSVQLSQDLSQPIFSTREVTTNVTVRDGETVVIGGLIQSRDSDNETKVPILGDLPYMGFLFRSSRVEQSKTELLVVLTVDILRTDEDVRRMSVEQRDKFVLPDTIRRSPLMEGLRIKPGEEGLGPRPDDQPLIPGPSGPRPMGVPAQQFGPQPKTYGPKIEPPPAQTTTASAQVYGPRIVRDAPMAVPD